MLMVFFYFYKTYYGRLQDMRPKRCVGAKVGENEGQIISFRELIAFVFHQKLFVF